LRRWENIQGDVVACRRVDAHRGELEDLLGQELADERCELLLRCKVELEVLILEAPPPQSDGSVTSGK
jgi:hypothetical protein